MTQYSNRKRLIKHS